MMTNFILAEVTDLGHASNTQVGLWVVICFGVANGVVAIVTIFSLFATRREFDKLDERVKKLEENDDSIRVHMQEMKDQLILSGDRRSSVLHNRINPMVETLSALKASNEAFVVSFNNFTQILQKDRATRGREHL